MPVDGSSADTTIYRYELLTNLPKDDLSLTNIVTLWQVSTWSSACCVMKCIQFVLISLEVMHLITLHSTYIIHFYLWLVSRKHKERYNVKSSLDQCCKCVHVYVIWFHLIIVIHTCTKYCEIVHPLITLFSVWLKNIRFIRILSKQTILIFNWS